ncbi:MAG: hypothetical protein WC489_06215 [Patescibacteria group bacterium]|jgi:hypothetical protein
MNLKEIEQHGYIIRAGNKRYLYDGPKSGLKNAVQAIKYSRVHAGDRVTYSAVK